MKKIKMMIFLFVSGLFVNCATPGFGPMGLIFTQGTIPGQATKIKSSKEAESCVHGILGLVAFGGKSVPDIAKEAGMTTVNNITYKTFSFIIYSRLCAVVEGE